MMIQEFVTPQNREELRRVLFLTLHEALRDFASVVDQGGNEIELHFHDDVGDALDDMTVMLMTAQEAMQYRGFLREQARDQANDAAEDDETAA